MLDSIYSDLNGSEVSVQNDIDQKEQYEVYSIG